MPTVTRAPSTSLIKLPAPLYLIDSKTEQIIRLETDGKTTTPITSEAKPVTDFDVSPKDGSLAYVSDNDLILTDALGRHRIVSVDGDSIDPQKLTSKDYWTRIIDAPCWSPDGKQVAFGLGGINLMSPIGGKPQLILPNEPIELPDKKTNYKARRFNPSSWSPDGTRLLLEFSWYVEAGGHAAKNFKDGRLVEMEGGGVFNRPAWNIKSTLVYRPNVATIIGGGKCPDLDVLDVETGKSQPLITGADDPNRGGPEAPYSSCAMVIAPYQASDGKLYLFLAFTTLEELFPLDPTRPFLLLFGMYRAAVDGKDRVLLRDDIYNVWNALWAPDTSGAIVISGEMLWVPADSTKPLVVLPVNGGTLRWGK
jgi:hypothetical protein